MHGANGAVYTRDDWMPFARDVPGVIEGYPDFIGGREIQLGGDYPSSRRNLPFFNLETPEGRGVVVGVGWTGSWLAKVRADGHVLTTTVGFRDAHFLLHPGEQVRTARILLLLWEGKRLHGHNMLRQLLHQHYVPPLGGKPQEPRVSANIAFAYHGIGEFLAQATEQTVVPLVKPFIRLGAEILIIDAGWYNGAPWDKWLGNWRYSKDKYPQGFRPIAETLAASHVALGLWFAPEVVSKSVPVWSEHPEWIRPLATPLLGDGYLRIELPEVRNWFLQQIDKIITEQSVTCYRQDGYNTWDDVRRGEPPDRRGIREIQYITALYALEDTIRQRHPGLIMEAAVGAPRLDLEMVSRFHWHQPCETWFNPNLDQCALYGTNLYLPGGTLVLYTPDVDNYGMWSRFAGQLSLAWHPLDADFPWELARRQVERYKHMRGFLNGDFYPLTPCSLEEVWMGYQFHRPDLDKGVALVFRRYDSNRTLYPARETFTLRLRGLNPARDYRVSFEAANHVQALTGEALARGVELSLGKPPAAEMISYKPAD